MAEEDLLRTGDFSKTLFNLDSYVEQSKAEAKERLASKATFLDDLKRGMVPSSPLASMYDLNKNFATNAIGDPYIEPGKKESIEKLASKEKWMDEPQHGFKYSSPLKRCSTPGDAYANCSQKNIEVRESVKRKSKLLLLLLLLLMMMMMMMMTSQVSLTLNGSLRRR